MGLKLITAPAAEPITLEEAKLHLRVVEADDDSLITALIVAARQGAEQMTGRALMPQTWELSLDEFPDIGDCSITLPRPPFASITSVKYLDAAGTLQTMESDAYLLDEHILLARLLPAYGTSWPTTRDQANAVLVRYAAGYANAAAVPQEIKSWMLLRIGLLYENREAAVAGAPLSEVPFVDRLLDAYKVWSV